MKKAHLLSVAVIAAGFALSAGAKEQPVGVITGVQGNVSIGGNGFVSKAGSGAPVADGSTVLVSTNGRAIIKFNNGCSISLGGGQHLTIDSTQSCAVLQASVKQLFSPYRVAQVGIGGGPGGGAGGAAGLGTGFAIAGAIVIVGAVAVNEDKVSGL